MIELYIWNFIQLMLGLTVVAAAFALSIHIWTKAVIKVMEIFVGRKCD